MKLFNIKVLMLLLALTFFTLNSCSKDSDKDNKELENAQENVQQAKEDLQKARNELNDELIQYRIKVEERLNENTVRLSAMRENSKAFKKALKEQYEKDIAEYEQRNSTLKAKMYDYKDDIKENWETFKLSFNQEMDELGKAISEKAEDNMKKK